MGEICEIYYTRKVADEVGSEGELLKISVYRTKWKAFVESLLLKAVQRPSQNFNALKYVKKVAI